MTIPSKSFSQLITDMTTQWANAIGITPALQPGDMLLAVMEAFGGQVVFLEGQAQATNLIARAATSTGADLDSFFAQFSFVRLPATYNTGPVTFGKFSASSSQILIPVGTIVQTTGGAAQYQVVADTTQPTWNAALDAYVMAAGQTSLTATVQALVAGTGPNVGAGLLNQIGSNLPGIDTVTNSAAINNGVNAETDDAFRARFVLYLAGLSKATEAAILSAIAGVQQNLQVNLLENETPSGSSQLGQFTAVIDDGSGDPPANLITSIQNAVNAVRGFTILANVIACTKVEPTVSLNIRVASGYTASLVQTAAQAAAVAAINGNVLGTAALFVSTIEGAALAVPGVTAVEPGQTKINGSNADLALTAFQVSRVQTSDVSVGTY